MHGQEKEKAPALKKLTFYYKKKKAYTPLQIRQLGIHKYI